MITDLANLGPSPRTTSDLRENSKKEFGKSSQSEKSGSFDQIFQEKKMEEKSGLKSSNSFDKITSSSASRDAAKMNPERGDGDRVKVGLNKSEPRTAPKEKMGEKTGSVKDKESSEKVGNKSNSQAQERQDVMLKFMDSMESEFGIPPTQMVEAMTSLSDRDLKSSPEDSASQVIAQLDLPKEDEQKALALYMSLLAQLNQLSQQPTPPSMMVAGGTTAAMTAALPPQERRALMNHSLEQMNQKFFMQGDWNFRSSGIPENPSAQGGPVADELRSGLESQSPWQSPSGVQFDPPSDAQSGKPKLSDKLETSPDYGRTSLPEQMQALDPNSNEAQEMAQKLAALGFAAGTLNEDTVNSQSQQVKGNPSASKEDGASDKLTTGALSSAILAAAQSRNNEEDQNDSSENSFSSNSFFPHPSSHPLDRGGNQRMSHEGLSSKQQDFGAMLTAAGALGANQAAGQSENKAAIQQIMNQAQFMIKKGGGEAKVQLNPEGLGEIHMKVSVNDGKVGIQMSAETKEAKKLIESSLHDLRSSLGEHKLTVGHVNVDVGNQASSDNNNSEAQKQQRQMDMSQNNSREQAREFWSQFDQGQDRRTAFMENTGIRAYGGSKRKDPLTPETAITGTAKRYSGSGKGRGLDLVA